MQKISLFIPKFGISINAALFADRQSRLYNWLFGQSDRAFHINELRRLTGLGSASFQRELKRLATAGLIETQAVGQSASFSGESSIARFTELVALTRKTLDVVPVLGDVLTTLLPGLQSACVYGSVAKQTDTARSDIDVMLIGNLKFWPVESLPKPNWVEKSIRVAIHLKSLSVDALNKTHSSIGICRNPYCH